MTSEVTFKEVIQYEVLVNGIVCFTTRDITEADRLMGKLRKAIPDCIQPIEDEPKKATMKHDLRESLTIKHG
jgi:hypothetical protein